MPLRNLSLLTLAAVVGGIGLLATPTPIAAQQQCVPAGANITPVPWAQRMLGPDRAWPMASGQGQRVAVISTGTADNPQLTGRVAESVDLAPADGRTQPSGAADCLGIGTGVAGIVAARSVDAVGFHGVAPDARLLSAKVVGDRFPQGAGQSVAPGVLASAIEWATEQGATVIAVPTITYQDSRRLRQAVREALDREIVLVAATGEVTRETPFGLTPYPAAYDGVLGVSGIGRDGLVTKESRPEHVDLVAPGYGVLTTFPGGGLGEASGSAFATAYVAGTVALVRSYRPDAAASDVVRRLRASAAPAPEAAGSQNYGQGLVNPYQALVENLAAGNPADLPPMTRATMSAAERARAQAEADSDRLAFGLAGAAAVLAVGLTAVVVFGPRGRGRRWRSGLADTPRDRPEDELPEPPVELFGDRPRQ